MRDAAADAALARAKRRLDRLTLYPGPVRVEPVRVLVLPPLFRLPWFRRFDGYSAWNTILLSRPLAETDDDLVCHELCHVWQMQHLPLRMPLSYLRHGYAANPYEHEARRAVAETASGVGRGRTRSSAIKQRRRLADRVEVRGPGVSSGARRKP